MEAIVIISSTEEIHSGSSGYIYIEFLVSDDDNTMRVLLTHQSYNEKGRLPPDIPTPKFLSKPIHLLNIISKPTIPKVTDTKDPVK